MFLKRNKINVTIATPGGNDATFGAAARELFAKGPGDAANTNVGFALIFMASRAARVGYLSRTFLENIIYVRARRESN